MSEARRPAALVLVTLAVFLVPPATSGADAGPSYRCAAAKLTAAARKHAKKLRCHIRAVSSGESVEPACLAAAEERFAADFAKAEAKGGCATVGDEAAVEAGIDNCVDTLVGLLPPVTTTTTTVVPTTTTTTTQPDVTCSPVGAACGSCGSGFCFSPVVGATSGVCVDAANSSGTPCGIDPPTPCPPGEGCLVVQFSPAMFVCARPCP
jgi:hypothetical protein